MFYKMIDKARDRWFDSKECTVRNLVDYIVETGQMRDAQIEAIKTYLFLKIKCRNQPLDILFTNGVFNNLNLDELEISNNLREYLKSHPSAAALYEYASLKNDKGEQVSEKIVKQIKKDPESIVYKNFFFDMFYQSQYTEYLFSLPMGAGKTYLMAAFVYLDLYFASMEPQNPAFAHNFIIFAPSGLKSSVVPSLKTIQKFNPAWIIPEPAATEIKRKLIFEVLDQSKTDKKSNKTKNPNVQKIANHQPFNELFGLVAVTNAEKVILDRIKEADGRIYLFEDSDDEKDRQANELRNLLGKLPSLSVFVDEMHHAVKNEIKLRAVINTWMKNKTVNSVIGFSGTPYLEKAEKIKVADKLNITSAEITNVVYYYPLIKGIGNFLKKPIVKISNEKNSAELISKGVNEFLDNFKDTVYENGLTAKLAIYCGTIEKCEEIVYPLVKQILNGYNLYDNIILKFHKGNKQYPQPADSQMLFNTLDTIMSPVRIILLVQIGKEGWDCSSLAGVILSQEGDCPTNMVLQTSCRCLRQVVKNEIETALIYLNDSNAQKLQEQLKEQQRTSIKELTEVDNNKTILKRYNRTAYLKLPKIEYYQLKINYDTVEIDDNIEPDKKIKVAADNAKIESVVKTTDFTMKTNSIDVEANENGNMQATFNTWLYNIVKGSFGFITMNQLNKHANILKVLFNKITYIDNGICYYSSLYNHALIEANIRKAFYQKRDFKTVEELIPDEASLLNIANFTLSVSTDKPQDYYPPQEDVKKIIDADSGKIKLDDKTKQAIQSLEAAGFIDMANKIKAENLPYPNKDRSFHYLPYHTDSYFEQKFLDEVLKMSVMESLGLEIYYNGDRAMTEFKIKCYKHNGNKWQYLGMYTPDFLIIKRKDGKINKAIIVETKGEIYANDSMFKEKRSFMEQEFIKQNNQKFGYKRFDYLYLEDTMLEDERIQLTNAKISDFFKE